MRPSVFLRHLLSVSGPRSSAPVIFIPFQVRKSMPPSKGLRKSPGRTQYLKQECNSRTHRGYSGTARATSDATSAGRDATGRRPRRLSAGPPPKHARPRGASPPDPELCELRPTLGARAALLVAAHFSHFRSIPEAPLSRILFHRFVPRFFVVVVHSF